jgi:hypothetical protein
MNEYHHPYAAEVTQVPICQHVTLDETLMRDVRCQYPQGSRVHNRRHSAYFRHDFQAEPQPLPPGACGEPGCTTCRANQLQLDRLVRQRREQARLVRTQVNGIRSVLNEHVTEVQSDEDGARMLAPTPDCTCELCKLLHHQPSKLGMVLTSGGGLDGHASVTPTGWIPRGEGPLWLGVELETDTGTSARTQALVDANTAAAMAMPDDGFWWTKRDGSVHGPEFASMPANLDTWKSYEGYLQEMFRMLIHAGYRSHNGGRAGMHVSFSKGAVESKAQLGRILRLIYDHPKWSLAMSQRTAESAQHWARLTGFTSGVQSAFLGTLEGQPFHDSPNDRYIALNNPEGEHNFGQSDTAGERYEFRLPRGTLRLDRFLKNLEWVHGMVRFCKEVTDRSFITPAKFMEWVGDRDPVELPHLWKFIQEKNLLTGGNS